MMEPTDGFDWLQAPAGRALVCRALVPFALHLFTTRGWALGSPYDQGAPAAWRDVAEALGVEPGNLVRAHQVHGATVTVRRAPGNQATAQQADAPAPLPDADIIITDDSRIALAIQTADCVPILLVDPRSGAVGAAHAGWRGLAARAPQAAVDAMAREFGSRPGDLMVAIGPSISAARYEVGLDVRESFERARFAPGLMPRWFLDARRTDHWLFDGWQSARDQLEAAGVPRERIHLAALCTAAHPDWFCSYRRDAKAAGRMAAAIRARGTTQRPT